MLKIAIERRTALGVALGAALLSVAPVSLHWSPASVPSLSFDKADARVGHPLSAGSVAGVHRRVDRRTARRAYYGGAAAAGAAGVAANTGYSSGSLFNAAPPAAAAPPATAAPAAAAAPAADTATPAMSPELYAACLNRTYGACPNQ